jgi:hypothetical protein
VPCPECSAKDAGLDALPPGEPAGIWVRVKEKDRKKEVARGKPRKVTAKPKRKLHAWEVFLANE